MNPKFNPRAYSPNQLPGICDQLESMLHQVKLEIKINQIIEQLKDVGYFLEFSSDQLLTGFKEHEIYADRLNEAFPGGWEEIELLYDYTLYSHDKIEHKGISIELMPWSQNEWVKRLNFKAEDHLSPEVIYHLKRDATGVDWERGDDWDSPDKYKTRTSVWLIFPVKMRIDSTTFQVINSDGEILTLAIRDRQLYCQETSNYIALNKKWFILP